MDNSLRLHVAVAIRAHLRGLRRDGLAPPPGLAELADRLLLSGHQRPELGCWCGGGDAGPAVLVGAPAAAASLGVSPRSLRRLAATGAVPQVHVGRRVLYRPADLERFATERRAPC
jgi:hypothetical protein